uniref:Ubiquitin associated protein 2a n=1 Tax=Cynoglossus semilaevis TaxID=244447 RepID=A0A3P8VVP8_CYNSE
IMSLLCGHKTQGPREKVLPTAAHLSQPQKQIQASAEQIQFAQMIYDKNDSDFEDKVNQLMEVTGKNQDECMVALHDCNEDVSKAINFLLESSSDMTSWETVGKKKALLKDSLSESKENKENREKKGEREVSRGRPAGTRKGKASNLLPNFDHFVLILLKTGIFNRTFNPADYTSEARTGSTQTDGWDTVANSNTDGTVAWKNTLEDWAAEDWNEDVEMIFDPYNDKLVSVTELCLCSSLDLTSIMKIAVDGREPPSSSQSLVFTNSQHHQPTPSCNTTTNTSYAHAALSSVLGAGFGKLTQAKTIQPSPGAHLLEQLKAPGLGPLSSAQATSPAVTQRNNISMGRLLGQEGSAPAPSSSSWDMKDSEPNPTSLSSQFSREFGLQPEPSVVLSQLRHNGTSLPLARQPSPPLHPQATSASASPAPQLMTVVGVKTNAPNTGLDPQNGQGTPQQLQQRAQLKSQKRRIPPTSKIPSTAVEMPGSADVPGLNLQFGALDFGSESALPEFGVVDNCVSAASRESTPTPASAPSAPVPGIQCPTSLYSKPVSESHGSPPTVSLPPPLSSSEPAYHLSSAPLSSFTSSSLGATNANSAPLSSLPTSTTSSSSFSSSSSIPSPFSTVGGTYDGTMYTHTRLTFSQGKEVTGPVMVSDDHSHSLKSKAPPNLSQGVPPLVPNQYIMGPGGLLPAYPPSLQDYYGITFPGPTVTLSGRDGNLANNPYSGEVTKFGRNDSTSPAPPTSLAGPQPSQAPSQGQNQNQPQAQPQPPGQPQHHNSQQAFLPAGYSYTGLPYYPGVAGAVPSAAAFQYGPTMFVPPGGPGPASAKQHSMSLGLGNPSAGPFQQQTQQQPSSYSQHTFSSGYEDLTAGPAGVDYSKGYNSSLQAQAKPTAAGPGKGVSVTSSNSGVPDISGSVYNKTQSFDKQGFHAGTPPPFSLPTALGGPGPLNPGAAPGGFATAPFLHILPHQQPHSQLLHHHLAHDGQGVQSQRGQSGSLQQKTQVNKSTYGSSPYWAS